MSYYGNNYLTESFVHFILSQYNKVKGEQETKNKLIEPLFQQIGYDIKCIDDIRTEVDCGIGIRSEKIDYVLCIAGTPKILVEAKDWKVGLCKSHTSQLFRYFCSTDCKLAILTNGLKYWFYSDFDRENIMDEKPFYKLNILNPNEYDEKILGAVCKTNQCTYGIEKLIVELKTERLVRDKKYLSELLALSYFKNLDYCDAVYAGLNKVMK